MEHKHRWVSAGKTEPSRGPRRGRKALAPSRRRHCPGLPRMLACPRARSSQAHRLGTRSEQSASYKTKPPSFSGQPQSRPPRSLVLCKPGSRGSSLSSRLLAVPCSCLCQEVVPRPRPQMGMKFRGDDRCDHHNTGGCCRSGRRSALLGLGVTRSTPAQPTHGTGTPDTYLVAQDEPVLVLFGHGSPRQ